MQRQDLAVHHNRPLELAKPWCAGITHWAHWWGQAFNQMMKTCNECARQRNEDGRGKPCTVGEAVAGASVFELCLSSAVAQAPCPGKPGTRHQLFQGPGQWVWNGVQKLSLWPCVGLDGSGTTSSRCPWTLFLGAELENSIKTEHSKRGQVL